MGAIFVNLTELFSSFNFDLLSVGVSIAAIAILGIIIFQNNTKSITSRTFFMLAIAASVWGLLNYFSYKISYSNEVSLWLLRLVIFTATWLCYFLCRLMIVFPDDSVTLPAWFRTLVLYWVCIVSFLTLTPFVFSGISSISSSGLPTADVQPGILLFGFTVISLIIAAFYFLSKRINQSTGKDKSASKTVLLGTIITFSLLFTFNFVLPVFFENLTYIPFGGLFIAPFILFTSYAIYRNGLFNIKVIATDILIFLLAVVTLIEVVFAQSQLLLFYKLGEFLLILFIGLLLLRSVLKEVEARKEIRMLADELAATNVQLEVSNERLRILDQRKSEFVSIASHQLRTPVTAIKGYTSLLLEDSYGKLSDEMRDPISKIFHSSERLVFMINDFLNVSKIEQGTMTYTFVPLDLKKMVVDLVEDFHVVAGEKKIDLATDIPDGVQFNVVADEGKIRQIISNLLDNSIKYTPEGSVRVILSKEPQKGEDGMVHLQIKDTGIGLSQDDVHHLFGKFTRGVEGSKVNTSGSGLGLYVAKQMMEKHQGNIWVDSEGKGKGSVFSIELPEFHGDLPK